MSPLATCLVGLALVYVVGCLVWAAWCLHCERRIERSEPLLWAIRAQREIRALPEVER